MPITIDGSGTISGLSAGGLPDSSVTASEIAAAAVTAAKLDGAQSGTAPIYGARAWVNFNGTGTIAIRASGNVSSLTDNGVGDYSVNYTTAMSSANYASAVTGVNTTSGNSNTLTCAIYAPTTAAIGASSATTTAVRVSCRTSSGNGIDVDYVSVTIFQ